MTRLKRAGELVRPWAGFLGAGTGWALAHQIGSNLDVQHCELMSPLVAVLIGFAGLSCAVGGGLYSYGVYRRGEAATGARHFLSTVSMLTATLFSVALVWQTISSLIIPRCYG